jgi:hypothetical protein
VHLVRILLPVCYVMELDRNCIARDSKWRLKAREGKKDALGIYLAKEQTTRLLHGICAEARTE